MVEKILSALKKLKAETYKINITKIKSEELFFIRKKLDMNRKKDVTKYEVTLYKDFKENEIKFRGESTVDIYPTMNDEEILEELKGGLYAASFVKNEYYPLPKSEGANTIDKSYLNKDLNLEETALKVKNALYKYDHYDNGGINSTEIFVQKIENRIINSEGIDVSFSKLGLEIEYVVDWTENGEEVEIYNKDNYDELNENTIAESVREAIEVVKSRAKAKSSVKTGKYDVILNKEAVQTFFEYYQYKANARSIYTKGSKFKIGDSIQGVNIIEDKINVSLEGTNPYDNDGVRLNKTNIIDDGILKNYYGNFRYSSYLEIKPTGNLNKLIVNSGNTTIEEMKKQPHLDLLAFSAFDMDPSLGNFCGEIRLGFYYDGENTIPITGGSISGNVKDVQGNMILSKEVFETSKFVGPKSIKLKGVTVAGN